MKRFLNWFRKALSAHQKGAYRPQLAYRLSPKLETLEDRTLLSLDLTGFANSLQSKLAGLQSHLTSALDSASQIPFLNQQLGNIKEAQVFNGSTLTKVQNAIQGAADSTALQTALFAALGNTGGLNIIGDLDGNGKVDKNDISVSSRDANINVEMRLHTDLIQTPIPLDFNLGLPGIPLRAKAGGGGVHLDIGFDYDLAVSYNTTTKALTFDTSKLLNHIQSDLPAHEMALSVKATLDKSFTTDVTLGFLEGSITDHKDTMGNGQTKLIVAFTLDGLDLTSLGKLSPNLLGSADLDLDLKGGFKFNGTSFDRFPFIGTEFKLHWAFDTAHESAATKPKVEFDHVSLNLGSFLSGALSDVLKDIQDVTKPLEPIVKVLKTPIPGLSDLSHAVGRGDVTLESIAQAVSSFLPPDYKTLIDVITTVADVAGDINKLDVSTNQITIDFGDFSLGGASDTQNPDLRTLAPALDPSKALIDLTNLQPNDATFNSAVNGVKTQLKKLDGTPLGGAADAASTALDRLTDDSKGIKLSFPIFDDPVNSVFRFLLGQDVDFIRFSAQFRFPARLNSGVPAFGVTIGLGGEIDIDASFKMAYDTFGVREFLRDVAGPSPPSSAKLKSDFLDGLYIDTSSHLNIKGHIDASLGVNLVVFSASIEGGIFTGDGGTSPISITLNDPDNDGAGTDHKLRASELASEIATSPDSIFQTSGELDAGLVLDIKVGADLGFAFLGYEDTIDIATIKLVDFNHRAKQEPQLAGVPAGSNPTITGAGHNFTVIDPQGVLWLNMGPHAADRQQGDTSDGDEVFTVTHANPQAGDPAGGEAVFVSALGYTQRYAGVKKIVADGGKGDNTIIVGEGVGADADLTAGHGNGLVRYLGTGHAKLSGGEDVGFSATLIGGAGSNVLIGGHGFNHLQGGSGSNILSAGDGTAKLKDPDSNTTDPHQPFDDVLIGGSGPNTLIGGNGRDEFVAGPGGDSLVGGSGTNLYVAGAGTDNIAGGGRANTLIWRTDDGDVIFAAGAGQNAVELAGTYHNDVFTLSQVSGGGDHPCCEHPG